MSHTIHHQEQDAKGALYTHDGQRLAEMTGSCTNATMIIVDHTKVDPSLSGQGVGAALPGALVEWARTTGTKVVPLCPFAKAQFGKDASTARAGLTGPVDDAAAGPSSVVDQGTIRAPQPAPVEIVPKQAPARAAAPA